MRRNLARPIERAATQLYRYLNTPRALSCYLLTKNGEWDTLATMAIDPAHYLDTPSGAEKLRRDAQATDFLRKFEGLPTSFDLEKRALDSFKACEEQCAITNYMLDMLTTFPKDNPLADALIDILSKARKIVRKIMGPLPAYLDGRFGPGTSFELRGTAFSTLADKLWCNPNVTSEAYAVWRHTVDGSAWDRSRLELGLPHYELCRGNRFTTVAKDAKSKRGICIEPLGNLYCQLGVGSHLKDRLAQVGIYVQRDPLPACPIKLMRSKPRPNGQHIHRQLAEMASRDGMWATIDLSNASDTVARNLVRELLPKQWYLLLSSLRSPKTRMPDGTWVHLEKFSSMGNGFTFELETLLFAAIAAAAAGLEVGVDLFVYGDDIIVPTRASANVLAALESFGFTPNRSKTFTQGSFRESCGGDYFAGFDVRSVFLKEEPSDPTEWTSLHNALWRKWPRATHTLRYLVEQIPTLWRHFGPSRAGDLVLQTSYPAKWRPSVRTEADILWIRGVVRTPLKLPLERWGDQLMLPLALLGVPSSGISPRGEIVGLRKVSISVS